MFASSKLSLHQTQQILEDLNSLHTLFVTQNTVFIGSNSLATAPSHTVSQKICNYVSTWTGWSQNLCYLPPLVDKVAAFIRSDEGNQIDPQKVENAIVGLGILLNIVKQQSADQGYVEQAIVKLCNALGLKTLSLDSKVQQTGLNQYLWKSTKPYLPYFSVPAIVHYALATMWRSKPLILNNEVNKFKFAEEFRQIQNHLYFDIQINNIETKNSILSLLADKELNALREFELNDKKCFAPSQFFVDCGRMSSIKVNGVEICDRDPKQTSSRLEELAGTPLFYRLGVLVHQSCQADSVVKLCNQRLIDLPNLYVPSQEVTSFEITIENEKVRVNSSLTMELYFVNDEGKSTVGHFVMEREMTFALSELLDPNSKQPSLVVKDTLSDFYPTFEEAKMFGAKEAAFLPILSYQTGNGVFAGFPREIIQLILSKRF